MPLNTQKHDPVKKEQLISEVKFNTLVKNNKRKQKSDSNLSSDQNEQELPQAKHRKLDTSLSLPLHLSTTPTIHSEGHTSSKLSYADIKKRKMLEDIAEKRRIKLSDMSESERKSHDEDRSKYYHEYRLKKQQEYIPEELSKKRKAHSVIRSTKYMQTSYAKAKRKFNIFKYKYKDNIQAQKTDEYKKEYKKLEKDVKRKFKIHKKKKTKLKRIQNELFDQLAQSTLVDKRNKYMLDLDINDISTDENSDNSNDDSDGSDDNSNDNKSIDDSVDATYVNVIVEPQEQSTKLVHKMTKEPIVELMQPEIIQSSEQLVEVEQSKKQEIEKPIVKHIQKPTIEQLHLKTTEISPCLLDLETLEMPTCSKSRFSDYKTHKLFGCKATKYNPYEHKKLDTYKFIHKDNLTNTHVSLNLIEILQILCRNNNYHKLYSFSHFSVNAIKTPKDPLIISGKSFINTSIHHTQIQQIIDNPELTLTNIADILQLSIIQLHENLSFQSFSNILDFFSPTNAQTLTDKLVENTPKYYTEKNKTESDKMYEKKKILEYYTCVRQKKDETDKNYLKRLQFNNRKRKEAQKRKIKKLNTTQ